MDKFTFIDMDKIPEAFELDKTQLMIEMQQKFTDVINEYLTISFISGVFVGACIIYVYYNKKTLKTLIKQLQSKIEKK